MFNASAIHSKTMNDFSMNKRPVSSKTLSHNFNPITKIYNN